MKHSPLQLLRYFVPEIHCSANQAFDEDKSRDSGYDQFSVEATVSRQKSPKGFHGHSWSVEMAIQQQLKEGQNFPYQFKLIIIGIFVCNHGKMTDEAETQFVKVNGSSLLYGAACELIRSTTALGLWGELMLPTTSFYDKDAVRRELGVATPKTE